MRRSYRRNCKNGEMAMTTYKIVRHYQNGEKRTIKTGLTLDEAQEYCKDSETSSLTCTLISVYTNNAYANRGAWFDGYEEE